MSHKINPMCVNDIYFIDQNQHSISQLLVACLAPSHYMHQFDLVPADALEHTSTKFASNHNISIQENAF